jgi:2-hydroxychromene-2-carboxylate isomerase
VGLLANLELSPEGMDPAAQLAHDAKLVAVLGRLKLDLQALPRGASDDEARRVLGNLAAPLLELSKCPDLVVNRGHYFGTDRFAEEPGLSDGDKRALIEFLKTL